MKNQYHGERGYIMFFKDRNPQKEEPIFGADLTL